MKTKTKIFWGIVLILAAIAVIAFALNPTIAVVSIPIWKIIIGILLLCWIIHNVIFGDSLAQHFDIFFPIGLGIVVFHPEIAALLGKSYPMFSNWLIIVAAVLLTIAVHVIFPNKTNKHKEFHNEFVNANSRETHNNKFSSRTLYFDATSTEPISIDNAFGATEVFFQNVDEVDENVPIYMNVNNKFGAVEIQAPNAWRVENSVNSSLGAVDIKNRSNSTGKKIILTGTNKFGAIEFK